MVTCHTIANQADGFHASDVSPLGCTQADGNAVAVNSQGIATCAACNSVGDSQASTGVGKHIEDNSVVAATHGDALRTCYTVEVVANTYNHVTAHG